MPRDFLGPGAIPALCRNKRLALFDLANVALQTHPALRHHIASCAER